MAKTRKTSLSLTEDETAIADAIAQRLKISRSEVFRHLLLYAGMTGGDFPLTSRILALPEADRDRITAEIRRRAEADEPAKPASFAIWIKDALGDDDPATVRSGCERLISKLLDS